MNKVSEEEKFVSQFYHSIEKDDELVMPPANVDSLILKAATTAVKAGKDRKRNKYLMPLSAAASVLIIVTVALQVSVINNQSSPGHNELSVRKQPMYMLQRSKPASAEEMVVLLTDLLDKGDIDQARILLKKIKVRYPDVILNSDLIDRLN